MAWCQSAEAGHDVPVIAHRNRAPIDDLVSKGAREARDMAELAEADAILLLRHDVESG